MNYEIPSKYETIVRNAVSAAIAIGPVGLFGAMDYVAVGGVWATMFVAIKEKAGFELGENPKKLCSSVAMGVAGYYVGSKIASWMCFLIPIAGPVIGASVSSLVNAYFTYRFAVILISLMDRQEKMDDEALGEYILSALKTWPSLKEMKQIIKLLKSWFDNK